MGFVMIQLPWASSSVFVCSASSGVSVVFKERYRSQYLQSHWRMLRDVESGEDARQIVETFSPETFLKGRKGCFVRVSVFVACITQIWSAPRSRYGGYAVLGYGQTDLQTLGTNGLG